MNVKVDIGGLLRCCIQTVQTQSEESPTDGAVLNCEHCKTQVIFRDGVWQWLKEEDQKETTEVQ